MKRISAILLTVIICSPVFSQEEDVFGNNGKKDELKTLFGDRPITHGGYGSLMINFSQIDDKDAVVIGARGAWIIGHSFAFGVGGIGFINDYHFNPDIAGGRDVNLTGGYGGMYLEPIIFPKIPVHLSIPVMLGVGGIAYTTSYNPYDWYETNYYIEDATSFLIVEPGVELEFNIVRFFRLALAGTYRYTSRIRLYDTREDVLNGFSAGITFKFGKF